MKACQTWCCIVAGSRIKHSAEIPSPEFKRRTIAILKGRLRAITASNISKAHGLALADAAMYSMALEFKAQFWTQDIDYQGLPQVQYFAKIKAH